MTQRLLFVAITVVLAIAAVWWSRTEEPAPPAQAASGVAGADASSPVPASEAPPVAAPAVRDAASPITAAKPAELPFSAWRGMLRRLGAGELEVLVVRGVQPVAGVPVRVWPRGPQRLGNAKDRGAAIHEGRTDATGRVRFLSVALDDVVVRADLDGHWLEAGGTALAHGQSGITRTIVLAFGSATIVGSVRDDSGAPRAGVSIYVVNTYPNCTVVAVTDEAGRFDVGGLYGGRYHVQIEQVPERWSAANERMLTLQPGESARMDLGGPTPAGSLRARIVDAEGNAVHGERGLRLRHVVHNDEHRVRTNANGEFTIALPPGRWEAFIDRSDTRFESHVLVAADIDRAEVRADLVLPGVRLLALVTAPRDVSLHQMSKCFSLGGDLGHSWPDAAFVADGRTIVQWTALVEGRYELQIGNGLHFVDAPDTGVAVHVSAALVQRVFVNVRR